MAALSMSVKFRFLFGPEDARHDARHRKLLSTYSRKLSELISFIMTAPLASGDYQSLPTIRSYLRVHGTLDAVLAEVGALLPPRKLKLLVDVAPIFDIAPIDWRAFALLALGVRAHNLSAVGRSAA